MITRIILNVHHDGVLVEVVGNVSCPCGKTSCETASNLTKIHAAKIIESISDKYVRGVYSETEMRLSDPTFTNNSTSTFVPTINF